MFPNLNNQHKNILEATVQEWIDFMEGFPTGADQDQQLERKFTMLWEANLRNLH